MRILLLNDNPVVNKLVTLSAQKTSDELDVVDSIESIESDSYDLLVIDDAMYNENIFEDIKSKIRFSASLYICSRDAEKIADFTATLKKPFLPTDLVELFLKLAKEIDSSEPKTEEEPEFDEVEELEEFNDQEMELEEEAIQSDAFEELSLEEEELDITLDDEISLEEDLEDIGDLEDLDELDEEFSFEEELDTAESVLDDEEAQKVKDLLEETSEEVVEEYDAEYVAKELGLSLEEVEEFIQDFIVQAKEFKEELYNSAQESDLDTVQKLSHKLKGVAINLKIQEAQDTLEIINKSSNPEEIKSSLDDFYVLIEKLSKTDIVQESVLVESEEADELILNEELILDDTQDMLEKSEEDLDIEEENLNFAEDLNLEEETVEENLHEAEAELSLEEELSNAQEDNSEIETLELEELEESLTPQELESQIESAVEELSDEDLESELDEETLLEIASHEIDSFDSLTSQDIKLALNEEFDNNDDNTLEDVEALHQDTEDSLGPQTNDIQALEKLLELLKDKEVLASMKGTKININITIGEH